LHRFETIAQMGEGAVEDDLKQAGLLSKSNWQHYPAAMLKSRAVSECARDACQEVLLGMQYTPDELGADDDGGEVIHDGFPAGPDGRLELHKMTEDEKDAAGVMTRPQRVEHEALRREGTPPAGAVEVLYVDPRDGSAPVPVTRRQAAELAAEGIETIEAAGDPWTDQPAGKLPKPPQPPSKAAHDRLTALLGQLQLGTPEDEKALIDWVTGRKPGAALTRAQVDNMTTFLQDALDVALKAHGGDLDEALPAASTSIWKQCSDANPQNPQPPEPA
jgi:hypothetical protein